MSVVVGIDFETGLLGPENLAPQPVCLSAHINDGGEGVDPDTDLELATHADGDLPSVVREMLTDHDTVKVLANAAFDLAVAFVHYPELRADIFRGLAEETIKDVQIREKLLILADTGDLDYIDLPDGSTKKIDGRYFSLEQLAYRYLGVRVEGKAQVKNGKVVNGSTDSWRLNYIQLLDVPLADWPDDAVDYAVMDGVYTTQVYRAQEIRRAEVQAKIGMDPLVTEGFRVAASFCLYILSMTGVAIDPDYIFSLKEELAEALKAENLNLLIQEGILRPAKPPAPYKSGAKDHVEGCGKGDCDCPPKMTKGSKESVNKKKLVAFVEGLAQRHGLELKRTPPSEKFPEGQVSVSKEFLDDHYKLSPVLEQYRDRQALQKLVTTDIPRMEWEGEPARILHASFDVLKATGRTSSYASKTYPSWNCQNPHPRIRGAVVPREEGWVLYSVDISQMELGTLAQKCLTLFGYSVLADKINAGVDVHAYLGAQLAYHLDSDFTSACNEEGARTPEAIYEAFIQCKDGPPEVAAIYAKYRKFAKPTNLGYPGGLGAETFVTYAHATYKVDVDIDLAHELKNIWFRTFPEMRDYFAWINDCCPDPHHGEGKYAYTTPLGLYRAKASFCAAANGAGLQAPGAEGAILGLINTTQATYDPSWEGNEVLRPDEQGERHRPLLFIHDEIVGEARMDVAHEVVKEVESIMVEAMRIITPQVTPRAGGCLMLRWDKNAEAVYENDRLVPWIPNKE